MLSSVITTALFAADAQVTKYEQASVTLKGDMYTQPTKQAELEQRPKVYIKQLDQSVTPTFVSVCCSLQ